ncbi:GTPase IMAP family member 8-like [Myripristis murdjan]|uniref:GTPase IMAP family member 8-like n=1 Tax=Myripristis murdjan TaxID=586833 RepID=UPI001175FBA2|nr:GTPase IMAP family member 8-like [Myripristis murdjan]
MATGELPTWDGQCAASHLKIVLLGGRNSGKSCLGNAILGKEEFVTKERTTCSRRLGVVAGRWVMVVDTPGWWCDFSTQDTCELIKREIVGSVSLCLPGPHVFLIVVKASSFFSGKRRRAVEEHLGLLGDRVWAHCTVVFTSADQTGHTGVEELVKRDGKPQQWLTERCQQRCHSVSFQSNTVGAQITEVLVGIQKLVRANGNRHFEMQESILQGIAEKKRAVEERVQQRFMKMKKQRSLLQENLNHLSDIRIVLVGARGSGRSSAVNTILGRGRYLGFRRTTQCEIGKGSVFGRHVTVVDTPGWWMNYFSKETPIFDQREIEFSLSLCPPGPHVVLLVIRVDRAFTETYRRAVQEHLELIGEQIWPYVMVLFNFGDWLGDTTIEQYIESEGEPLQWLVEKCSNRYHVLNNKTRGDGFQVTELMGKIEEMVAGKSGRHYEINERVMRRLEERMRAEKDRAEQRLMMKEKQRQMARSQLDKLSPLTELRIVLVGGRNTGKSSCGNTILGREWCDAESQTTSCAEERGQISGKTVTVLDTPGCLSLNSDLLMSPSACGCTAVLLVVNVSSSFTHTHREAMERQLQMLGDKVWSRVLVLFSHGDWLGDTSIEQRIESEGSPLQRLVERCGNRYHVLDNKNWGDGAQVNELLDQLEEMLVEERLAVLQRGDQMGKRITLPHELRLDGATQQKEDLRVFTRHSDQLPHELSEEASSADLPWLDRSGGPEEEVRGRMVALPGAARRRTASGLTILGTDGDCFTSSIAFLLSNTEELSWAPEGRGTVMVNFPDWFPIGEPHSHMRPKGKRQFCPSSPRPQAVVLVFPQKQQQMLVDKNEGVITVQSLCQPALRERSLRKLTESGGLQALIDQWGDSNLEELEAFIDSYFEMVWEQAMGSSQTAEPDCPSGNDPQEEVVVGEPGQDALLSIDRKLSKLYLLEGIQRDLAELKQSLERSWRAIQELRDKSKRQQDPNNAC